MLHFPLPYSEIKSLKSSDIEKLITLDSCGLLVGKNENIKEYRQRLCRIYKDIESIYNKPSDSKNSERLLIPELKFKESDIIDQKNYELANRHTAHYSFNINWAPGFYSKHSCGFLAGGATFSSENGISIFAIRNGFRNREKWLFYNVSELLSHEFCHVARTPLHDKAYEEFFAYKISQSKFRQYFGSFFHSTYDAIIMLLPLLLLMVVAISNTFFKFNIPELYFWLLGCVYPIFLFIRNHYFVSKYKKAVKALQKALPEEIIDSVLFRCTAKEIKEFAALSASDKNKIKFFLKKNSTKNLRWSIINSRFIKDQLEKFSL